MNITVFGTGYVGLVTGVCLADAGHNVLCVDIDREKISNLKQGVIPIFEPGLEELVLKNQSSGCLSFTTNSEFAVDYAELQFIAVGTPSDEDGSADLTYVLAVAETISQYMKEPKIIINKSTVPVGTADKVRNRIANLLADRGECISFEVTSNPEFLKEGSAINDFTRADRIVIGTESDWVKSRMRECYRPYNRNHDKIIFMDTRSAELTKYAANAMLATKISFMNELSNIAERLGADIENVRIGIGSDPRIGYQFIYPGCGYGGSCFPKDVKALIRSAGEVDYEAELIKAVDSVNCRQKETLFTKLHTALDGDLKGKTIAILGLSFKPNTDDMREAPSRTLIDSLWAQNVIVRAYDPEAMTEARRIYGVRADLNLCDSLESAVKGADALVICTEWNSFRTIDPNWLKKQLKSPVVVDGRNLFDPVKIHEAGLKYYAVGRADSVSIGHKS
ncbi:UDP-glucose/GDP-mannose dehydrogenase family protein [Porticoccaceae bacterium]|nr:UDP-glucose/GDP-mannose dehydrogenase family protein [Porticoccaceae bacterium]